MTPRRLSIVRPAALRWALLLSALLAGAAAPPTRAGDLEPPGPPAPTMKTLLQIPPTWSHPLNAGNGDADGCNSSRFTCVNAGVVLDNETGLVWQRNPGAPPATWETALGMCATAQPGFPARGGWRLPSLPEMTSLLAAYNPAAPFAFTPGRYWTMTTDASNLLRAWTATTGAFIADRRLKSQTHRVWCVRSAAPLSLY